MAKRRGRAIRRRPEARDSRVRRLAAVAAAGLALAPAAVGHGPAAPAGVGYVSTVASLEPNVLGVSARVLGGDDRLRLANYSGKTVVVAGYAGEPFLRFTPSGVYENTRSPATYLSRVRDPAQAQVPASADPKASPRWRKVARGQQSFEWHDHRIHWTENEPPAAVQRAPDEVHLIFRWAVPARADGRPFAISGFLGYVPPPGEPGGSGTSGRLLAAVIGGSVIAVAAIGTGARRARRRAP